MEPVPADTEKKGVGDHHLTLSEIMSNLTEDVKLAMEAMDRVTRLRRCTPPSRMPVERYYRIV